jgi:hypothetical protein
MDLRSKVSMFSRHTKSTLRGGDQSHRLCEDMILVMVGIYPRGKGRAKRDTLKTFPVSKMSGCAKLTGAISEFSRWKHAFGF